MWNGTETGPVVDFTEMERQLERRAHHHVNPSQPTPHPKVGRSNQQLPCLTEQDGGSKKEKDTSQLSVHLHNDRSVWVLYLGYLKDSIVCRY